MSNAMPGTDAAIAASASDEVIDEIAEIEMRRREAEKEAGLAASCSSALRKLHELLDRETETRRQSGAAGQPGNVEAVAAEIERLKKRAPATGQGPAARNAFPERKKASWQDARRNPARNKGRRTMGRAGGR
jgi:transposase